VFDPLGLTHREAVQDEPADVIRMQARVRDGDQSPMGVAEEIHSIEIEESTKLDEIIDVAVERIVTVRRSR